jgi:hypothetical protein
LWVTPSPSRGPECCRFLPRMKTFFCCCCCFLLMFRIWENPILTCSFLLFLVKCFVYNFTWGKKICWKTENRWWRRRKMVMVSDGRRIMAPALDVSLLGPWEDGPNFIPSSAWGVRSMYIVLVRRQSVLFPSGWLIYWMSLIDIVVVSSSAALLRCWWPSTKKYPQTKFTWKCLEMTMRAIIHFQHFCVSFRFGTVEGGRLPDRLRRRRQASQR